MCKTSSGRPANASGTLSTAEPTCTSAETPATWPVMCKQPCKRSSERSAASPRPKPSPTSKTWRRRSGTRPMSGHNPFSFTHFEHHLPFSYFLQFFSDLDKFIAFSFSTLPVVCDNPLPTRHFSFPFPHPNQRNHSKNRV